MAHSHNSRSDLNIFKNLHTESSQQVDKSNINGFYQKKFVWGKWDIFGQKVWHPHNSGLALRVVFKFCTITGAKRYLEIILIYFPEKILALGK